MRQTLDHAGANRIACADEDDRDGPRRFFEIENSLRTRGKERVHVELDQFLCKFGGTFLVTLRVSYLDENILSVDITEISHRLKKGLQSGVRRRARSQNPDPGNISSLLCVREGNRGEKENC